MIRDYATSGSRNGGLVLGSVSYPGTAQGDYARRKRIRPIPFGPKTSIYPMNRNETSRKHSQKGPKNRNWP